MESAVTLLPHPDSPTDPQGFAGIDAPGDAVDRPHHPAGGEEMGLQIVDLEQRFGRRRSRIAKRPFDRLCVIHR
jgi:hypothetical protein